MRVHVRLLLVVAWIILSLAGCGGGNDNGGPGASGPAPASGTTSSATSVTIDSSVPATSAVKVTRVSSPTTDTIPGKPHPVQTDGTLPMLVASDDNATPYLLAIGSRTGVLNADSTAVSLVRIALELVALPEGLSNQQVEQAIHSSSAYSGLAAAVQQDLAAGNSPLTDDSTINAAWSVAKDATTAISSVSSISAVTKADKGPVTLPLPFYLLDGVEPFTRVWVTDSGGNSVTINNQTFITWQVDAKDDGGKSIDSQQTPPLKETSWQLIGAYAGSVTQTRLTGTSPSFTLTLSQSQQTKKINAISAVVKYMLFTWSSVAGIYPKKEQTECIASTASVVLNDQLANLIVKSDRDAAVEYFISMLPISATGDGIYKKFSACELLPSVSNFFGKAIGVIWEKITLARDIVSTVGSVGQTWYYWNSNDSFRVCKSNGAITNCQDEDDVISSASCVKLSDVTMLNGATYGPSFSVSFEGTSKGRADFTYADFYIESKCTTCAFPVSGTTTCSAGWQSSPPAPEGGFSCHRVGNAATPLSFSVSAKYVNGRYTDPLDFVRVCSAKGCVTKKLTCQ